MWCYRSGVVEHRPIVLFDGYCHLCDGTVSFLLERDPNGTIKFAPLQSEVGVQLLKNYGLNHETSTVVFIDRKGASVRSTGVLRALSHLKFPWPIVSAFLLVPRFLRDAVYQYVAKNRYHWFGKRDICAIPSARFRDRFL